MIEKLDRRCSFLSPASPPRSFASCVFNSAPSDGTGLRLADACRLITPPTLPEGPADGWEFERERGCDGSVGEIGGWDCRLDPLAAAAAADSSSANTASPCACGVVGFEAKGLRFEAVGEY